MKTVTTKPEGRPGRSRWVLLALQVGAVAVLLTMALWSLWSTGITVVDHQRKRESATRLLEQADDALARQGAGPLALVPEWPATLDAAEWEVLDRWLTEAVAASLGAYPGVEGGYYVPADDRYLGHHDPVGPSREPDLPAMKWDLIDGQVRGALERNRPRLVVVETPGGTMALRAAPIWINARKVAATWTIARLDDPIALDLALRGYRRSAALALGGVAMALLLSLNLARTIRLQRRERDQLQTDLRRSERLAALGKMLAGVAHEVRNPLAGIRSTAQLWQRGIGRDASSAAALVAEADRLEAIVSRLLQFSKADAQELVPGDLNTVVLEAAQLAQGPAEARDVKIELDMEPAMPPVAMAPQGLVQVLRNLTNNAINAMPRGGTLRLSTRLDSSRRRVEVHVADTGPGLSDEVREHLFEPFFTTRPDGTGLGLAIAREIALGHGGDLRAQDRPPGTGAEFVLTLPVSPAGRVSNPMPQIGFPRPERTSAAPVLAHEAMSDV